VTLLATPALLLFADVVGRLLVPLPGLLLFAGVSGIFCAWLGLSLSWSAVSTTLSGSIISLLT
jgi:zinc/manganese transport system permease protein